MTPNRTRTVALVATLLLVSAVAVPASVAAADGATLSVAVDQQPDSGEALVTVTSNDAAVENATVEVNSSDAYNGTGTYTTDASGQVVLPAPSETVTATLTAKYNDSNVTEDVTLVPRSESLDVSVEQEQGENATVTVTQYGDAIESATVNVSTAENVSYAGNGSYETDADGTVDLPAPEDNVTVTVTAESGNLTDSTEATLLAAPDELAVTATQEDDGGVAIEVTLGDEPVDEATVTVEGNYTYADDYVAENGTLSLPAPTENTSIEVTATAEGQTANATLDLVVQTDDNPNNDFAEGLVTFIHFIQNQDVEGPLGQAISEYVHEHNPAAENAQGPPEHAGANAADDDGDDDEGNESERRGPPEHAGPPFADDDDVDDDDRFGDNESENETDDVDDLEDDDGDEDDADDEEEDDEEADEDDEVDEEDDDERGPPNDAGPK